MTETVPGPPRPGRRRGARAAGAPASGTDAPRRDDPPRGSAAGEGEAAVGGEAGAVTAEYAVLLPAVVLMVVAVVLAGAAGVQQVRDADAAAACARILARGDSEADAREAARRMAGPGVRLEHAEDAGWVVVTVSHPAPGPLGGIGSLRLEASAAAPVQGDARGTAG